MEKGIEYLRNSAKYGNEEAMLILSDKYFDGENLEKNDLKGYAWLKEAHSRENVIAKKRMGDVIENGIYSLGLKPDKELADKIRGN